MSWSSCGDEEGLGGVLGLADVVDLGAVHADDVEEGLAVDVEAGAGAAFPNEEFGADSKPWACWVSGRGGTEGGQVSAMRAKTASRRRRRGWR